MKWALIFFLLNSNTGEYMESFYAQVFDSQEACEYYLYKLNEEGPNSNYTLKRDDVGNLTLIDEDNVHRFIRACTRLRL
tara:strand:- start:652 stop:888 length:237 start_codon:yes stop_codon:yes gene_type:complete